MNDLSAMGRLACRFHLFRREAKRGIDLLPEDVAAIEAAIDKMRPAFERAGRTRYLIRVKRAPRLATRPCRYDDRIVVVYDTRLSCLVTVWHYWPREEAIVR